MARSNIPLDFMTPDFARVREETGVVTEEAVRSLYLASVDSRRRLLSIEQMLAGRTWRLLPGTSQRIVAHGP